VHATVLKENADIARILVGLKITVLHVHSSRRQGLF